MANFFQANFIRRTAEPQCCAVHAVPPSLSYRMITSKMGVFVVVKSSETQKRGEYHLKVLSKISIIAHHFIIIFTPFRSRVS